MLVVPPELIDRVTGMQRNLVPHYVLSVLPPPRCLVQPRCAPQQLILYPSTSGVSPFGSQDMRPTERSIGRPHTHTLYLEAVNVAVEWADRSSKAGAIRSPVLVGKLENLKRKKKPQFI